MKVTNRASYALIAFGWHLQRGYGEDVSIGPGETKEVLGPYLGEIERGKFYVHIPGEISCQEGVDNGKNFQVTPGNQLNLKNGDVGLTVRHQAEPRIIEQAAA